MLICCLSLDPNFQLPLPKNPGFGTSWVGVGVTFDKELDDPEAPPFEKNPVLVSGLSLSFDFDRDLNAAVKLTLRFGFWRLVDVGGVPGAGAMSDWSVLCILAEFLPALGGRTGSGRIFSISADFFGNQASTGGGVESVEGNSLSSRLPGSRFRLRVDKKSG